KVPELAESITEGTISEWLIQPGESVEKGDPVLELETDKVNVEVNSDYSGVLVEHLAEEGDDVSVGDAIAKVDESGEASATPQKEASKESEESQKEEAQKSESNTSKAESEAPKEENGEKEI